MEHNVKATSVFNEVKVTTSPEKDLVLRCQDGTPLTYQNWPYNLTSLTKEEQLVWPIAVFQHILR